MIVPDAEVSEGLIAPDAAERDTLLLGDFSEHHGRLRIKLIAQKVGHRQPAHGRNEIGNEHGHRPLEPLIT